jgi:hypothetical protein
MTKAKRPAPTRDDVLHLCGELDDETIVAILALEPSHEDLEEVAAWLAGESDVMGEERLPLAGRAGQIYELIASDEEEEPRRAAYP